MKFFIANCPTLEKKLDQFSSTVTVEAEYGEVVVEGSIATLAHHGSRAGQPCPCLAENFSASQRPQVVGLSHVDLDALGGCMAVMGRKAHGSFWELAAYVDVNGPHKLARAEASEEDIAKLYAFWAYSQNNRIFPPRDGSVLDVTEAVFEYITVLEQILRGDPTLLEEGEVFRKKQESLNHDSFVVGLGGDGLEVSPVLVRNSDQFTNHLYVAPGSTTAAKAVVTFNEKTKAVTLSLAEPVAGVSCCNIAQRLWGPEAGGHAGIAGSPRGKEMSLGDAFVAADALCDVLRAVSSLL